MQLIERRIGLLFAVFLAMLAIAGLRAGWLGVVRADALRKVAATQQTAKVTVPAERGAITDRNGIELAVSQPATTVAVTPYLIKDPAKVAARLARPLRTPEDELLRQLTRRDTGFAYLAHRVPAIRARRVERMKIEGLEFIPEHRRTYPRHFLASQLIGGIGTEGTGLSGLEYSLDAKLRGRDGERRLVKDALGEAIELRETRPTKPGSQIRLTIDEAIQDKAEEVLADIGKTWRPHAATAIVMDPRTGALLALANWPRVDANQPGRAPAFARQNRAVGATYEPGSTFKPFTVAGALEAKEVTPETKFPLAPTIRLYDREIRESHPRGAMTLSTREILEQSSNVGAVTIGLKLGAKRFDRWVRRFGFGKPTGTDLPGEEAGIVLPLAKYSGASMGNLPIGQGLAVTPMQMAVAYSAIANGGVLRKPRIIGAIGDRRTSASAGRRVVSERTAAQVRTMLTGVVEAGGTAAAAAIDGYEIAGKTGTANKIEASTGTYSKTRYIASFVGFAPARKPEVLVTIMVDEPRGEIFGAAVAAPAFQEIMRFALPYLRIAPG